MRSDFAVLAQCKHDSTARGFDFSRCVFANNFTNTDPTAFYFISVFNTTICSARSSASITSFLLATQKAPTTPQRCGPYFWTWPRPAESWFEINYYNRAIPETYFRQQLRMHRETSTAIALRLSLTRYNKQQFEKLPAHSKSARSQSLLPR